jgi:hypothetical protein
MAAIWSACRARFGERLVPADNTLPPLILLPGNKLNHEQKRLTLANWLTSGPISDINFMAVPTPTPSTSMLVRSMLQWPKLQNSAYYANIRAVRPIRL